MWINGKIALKSDLSIEDLISFFPNTEAELKENKIVIETQNIPFFAEHKIFLKSQNQFLTYKLWIPSLGSLIFFMYLAVIFLAGFTNWKMLVVGSIIVTGIFFAIYVINDKGARKYLRKYTNQITYPDELFIEHIDPNNLKCTVCQTDLNVYAHACPICGTELKKKKRIKTKQSHTAGNHTYIKYHIKK